MSLELNPGPLDVYEAIIVSLRENKLDWIADSIENEVSPDRQTKRAERLDNEPAKELYSPSDKLTIALRIVLEIAEVPFFMWRETQDYFKKRLGVIEIVEEESETSDLPFGEQFESLIFSLRDIIEEASKQFELSPPDLYEISGPNWQLRKVNSTAVSGRAVMNSEEAWMLPSTRTTFSYSCS